MSEADTSASGKGETPTKGKKAARISPAAGVGVGVAIGSAAIVAALLYANRSKKTEKKG